MTFEFFRCRFRFQAADPLFFPSYKSGNLVRGAFGSLFRKLACRPECSDARRCDTRAGCPYARVFEPRAARGEGPSGLADWPRPFVFRAAHLDGARIAEGAPFHFDVHLFDVRDPALEWFEAAFAQLAREGLGPGRGRAVLTAVEQLDLEGRPASGPCSVDLAGAAEHAGCVRVRFLSPTELKSEQTVAERPEFAILFGRLRDRISTLRARYGAGPLPIDFRGTGERAAQVRMTRCELEWHAAERRSTRTGQRHPLGGFVGKAEYEGDLGEFMPYLRLGRWVGVGRHTVWGKGEMEATVCGRA